MEIHRMAEFLAPTHFRVDVQYGSDDSIKQQDAAYWFNLDWSADTIVSTMTRYVLFHLPKPAQAAAGAAAPPVAVNPRALSVPVVDLSTPAIVKEEVKKFFEEITDPSFVLADTDHWFSNFWSDRRLRYPNLWKVARIILAIPASSVTVESLFSVMGAVDTARRSRLTLDRVCQMTLTNYMRFYKNQKVSPSRAGVRGVRIPVFNREANAFSWARFPDERDVDAVMLAKLEVAAAEDPKMVMAEMEKDQLDSEDDDDDVEPPRKRAVRGGGDGGGDVEDVVDDEFADL